MKRTVRRELKLTQSEHDQLCAYATIKGISLSEAIRRALRLMGVITNGDQE